MALLNIMTMMISNGPFEYYNYDDILWSMIMTYGPFEYYDYDDIQWPF